MEQSAQSTASRVGPRLCSPFLSSPEDNSARVLVVDDENGIRRLLKASLATQGYIMYEAATGGEALNAVPIVRPDIIILDLGLPDMDGIDVTRSLREWTQTPIVILSVREHETDKISALDAGADDYMTKPFGPGELLARLRAALRHANKAEVCSSFAVGDLEVDLVRRVVQLSGQRMQLTPTEYDLLRLFVRHPDRVITHRQVIREVWGGTCYEDEMHLLRVNICNLRRKLEVNPTRPRYILTEPGIGYRLRTAPA